MKKIRTKQFIIFLVIITFFMRLSLGLRDNVNLATRLHEDDSFYLHNVSYFLAQGKGLTADAVHPTNGIQPLLVVLNVPFYVIAGSDKWMGLRLSFILSAIVDALSLWLLYRLLYLLSPNSEKSGDTFFTPPVIGCMMWTFLYGIILYTMNGMETGLYSMLILASVLVYAKLIIARREKNNLTFLQRIGFGIILGFMVLARIDGVLFVIAILCFDFFYYKERNILTLFTAPLTAFITSSPWWIYNYVYFGNIIPTSGQAESIGGPSLLENIVKLLVSLADILSAFFYLPFYGASPWLYPFWIIGILGIIIFIAKKFHLLKEIEKRYIVMPLFPLLFAGIALALYYTLAFHAPYFIPRYLQPLRIFWILIVAMSIPVISKKITIMQPSQHRLYKTIGILFLSGAAVFSFIGFLHNFTGRGEGNFYWAGVWASKHSGDKIGMQQSGTASFMSNNVVNLDGKVNAAVLDAMKKNERGKYILLNNISYIMDIEPFAKTLVDDAAKYGRVFTLIDSSGLMRIYKRE